MTYCIVGKFGQPNCLAICLMKAVDRENWWFCYAHARGSSARHI